MPGADPDRSPQLANADRVFLSGRWQARDERSTTAAPWIRCFTASRIQAMCLVTKNGPLFIGLETYCRGPVEFDLAHAAEAVRAHYPGVGQRLLDGCPQLVVAMVAAWRWELGDQYRVEGGFTALW
ncbi:hypothetical protein [Streptomyces olivaceoviridis]|uniref:hypothetical protein n=1 Tax=Streptomyces olivaceoviridis TaxID=1921 RepID=UPI0036CB31CF